MTSRGTTHGHMSRPADPMAIKTLLNDENGQHQACESRRSWPHSSSERSRYSRHEYMQLTPTDSYTSNQKSSPPDSDSAREKRDSYNEDQKYFIWYHRIVLGRSWERIEKDFEDHFGQRRSKSGLQCRFYRVLSEKGSGKVRDKPQPGGEYIPGRETRFNTMEGSGSRLA